jgi:hypothetical protein
VISTQRFVGWTPQRKGHHFLLFFRKPWDIEQKGDNMVDENWLG